MIVEKILRWGSDNPKKLFLLDGLGAILSAILLGVVLVNQQVLFGIPKPTLYFLAPAPCRLATDDK